MSEKRDNRKIESVKRGLTLIGETTSLEIIEHFERNKLPRHLLSSISMEIAQSYGIQIARRTGELMNESELSARHPEQTTLLDFRKDGEEE
tara:strand:- start:287 stop:559 length:273 start_codon:yes stop_codon:yes gene_type:complete